MSESRFARVLIRLQANILVDDECHARITDFGLTIVIQNVDSIRTNSRDHGHTIQWAAPEILMGEGVHSREADVFSFAMVMIEVRCERVIPARRLLIIALGIHRCSSLAPQIIPCSYVSDNTRNPPPTTNTSRIHRHFVVVDATLLEPTSSLTSGGSGNIGCLTCRVSSSFPVTGPSI